jgi:hypothetical protein
VDDAEIELQKYNIDYSQLAEWPAFDCDKAESSKEERSSV